MSDRQPAYPIECSARPARGSSCRTARRRGQRCRGRWGRARGDTLRRPGARRANWATSSASRRRTASASAQSGIGGGSDPSSMALGPPAPSRSGPLNRGRQGSPWALILKIRCIRTQCNGGGGQVHAQTELNVSLRVWRDRRPRITGISRRQARLVPRGARRTGISPRSHFGALCQGLPVARRGR